MVKNATNHVLDVEYNSNHLSSKEIHDTSGLCYKEVKERFRDQGRKWGDGKRKGRRNESRQKCGKQRNQNIL